MSEKKFPEWHNLPFRLTKSEIKHPKEVLKNLCWEYEQAEIRVLLWNWLVDTFQNESVNAGGIIGLYENIDKMVEAVFLIFSEKEV
ncbi:hypothetical protein CLV51_11066 [Chitinophaga niastensis]|uniref:Uncharacterized protein n=1 Tax=Chitinophaga niastensis TaxID=536980 RepID=A0A2P8H9J2_CHINA|nr:hypothetical protein [Chitinophaga niastensis]PSL42850.1 hypothetical protein CLV51_11066 [Chitinophaga niastensis]